jgi:hypothetical protein
VFIAIGDLYDLPQCPQSRDGTDDDRGGRKGGRQGVRQVVRISARFSVPNASRMIERAFGQSRWATRAKPSVLALLSKLLVGSYVRSTFIRRYC